MFLLNRRTLAAIGVTAAAIGSTGLLSASAQAAAPAGTAQIAGTGTVEFTALAGKANGLTITIAGQTVTLDDLVAIKAGTGCTAVDGDATKVTCTTTGVTTAINVNLGDLNDWVKNQTAVALSASGGAGNDTLSGGSGADRLDGAAGNDTVYGGAGNDSIWGQAGNDTVYGYSGNDSVSAGDGNDRVFGQDGNDTLYGGAGADLLNGANGIDKIYGQNGNDKIYAGAGETADFTGDTVWGGAGNDTVYGEAGTDEIYGGTGNDTISGGAGGDALIGESGSDSLSGGAGEDLLVGESVNSKLLPTGSAKAKDKLYGGTSIDLCLALKGAKYSSCEYKKWSDYVNSFGTSGLAAKPSAIEVRLASIA
jgi:Ca2+-binding RTX toxin-like protein